MEGRFADVLRGQQGYDVRGGKTDFIADVIKHMGEVAAISMSDGTCEIDEGVACKMPATFPKSSACVQVVIISRIGCRWFCSVVWRATRSKLARHR
jgi:hypothetical protein